jgi:hypothetical protein
MIPKRLKQWLAAQKLDRITAANRARMASPEYQRRSKASRDGWQRRKEARG